MAVGRGRGHVVDFDPVRGLGTIEADDGARLVFHCTQIADGGRDVPVGADVRYDLAPGLSGLWEAFAIEPV